MHELNVLAIDHDKANLTSLQTVVRKVLPRVTVLTALSGAQGIELARAVDPDVILLEIGLPGMDGCAVCRALKADDRLRHIPVVFLTAPGVDRQSRLRALEAGAEGFLDRPLDEVDLIAQICAMAKLKAALRNMAESKQAQEALHESDDKYHNITERVRTEQALRESETRYRQMEEQLRAVLDATPFPVALVDTQDNIIYYWSGSALTLFGHTAPTAAEWYQIAYPDPDYRREVLERWKPAVETARLSGQAVNAGEYRVTCRDGSVRICELYAAFRADRLTITFNDITKRKQGEKLQDVIYRIAQAADQAESLDILYPAIHAIIQEVMAADNFYIALYDEENDLLSYPYSVDEVDPPLAPQKLGKGLTAYVLRTGKSLLCGDALFEELIRRGEVELVGVNSPIWLGVPLIVAGKAIGIMAVQDYKEALAYGESELRILEFVSSQVAMAINRKRAEAALRNSEARFRAIFEHASDAIHLENAGDEILQINPRMCELMGYSGEELLTMRVSDLQAPEARSHSGNVVRDELARHGGRAFESLALHRNGRRVPVEVSVARVESAEGDLYVSIVRDITERKRAEAERARLLAQVQAQAQQIAQIMDSVPEGVLLLDADGQVLLANAVGTRDLALLAGAAVGERLSHLGDLPLAELLAAAPGGGLWHEIRAGQRTVEVIARPVVAGTAGSLAAGHWVLVINDVTYARDMRQQLQQQERLAAVGQLAAGIAHDFNNILAIIALNAPRIALVPGLPPRDRERLTVIIEQTDHATRLVQQLLDFSRRAVLERRPLDLAPLLKEQVKLLERTLPETIAVSLACAPGEYVVLADPTRLQQMLMNLAVNARDAMPAGGSLHLALTRQPAAPRPELPDGAWVRLEVADSGSGITPEAQAHLFEPFFTTKPPGQGTGLGLAQVHGIVKQHEGEIVVHSAAGEGTSVSIFLPALARTAPAAATPEAAAQDGGGETILVVEDNPALLDAMSDLIVALGYQVVGASHGREALAVLEARGEAIALVLSDLMMPVMGGEALLAAIRARGLSVPVVMLSGYPLEGELSGLKAQGLAGWLLKPVRRAQLAELLGQAIGREKAG